MIRKFLDKLRPSFEKGGKFHCFHSVFEGMETFLYVPDTTSKSGCNIHDSIDSKRIMSVVVIALIPALLFGMYNIGYQNYAAAGQLASSTWFDLFFYGFLAVLPKIIVSYIVGLAIEFAWAQYKGEEIQEALANTSGSIRTWEKLIKSFEEKLKDENLSPQEREIMEQTVEDTEYQIKTAKEIERLLLNTNVDDFREREKDKNEEDNR